MSKEDNESSVRTLRRSLGLPDIPEIKEEIESSARNKSKASIIAYSILLVFVIVFIVVLVFGY